MTIAFKLENGLRVFLIPSTHTHETIVRLTVENGSNSEASQRQHGLSHFVEHLIFKGSGSRRDSSVDGEFLDLLKTDTLPVSETDTDYVARLHGASYNACTTNNMTSFYYKSHAKHTKFFISWLSLILRKWDFDDEMIESEKGPITQELAMGLQQFDRQGIYQILENLYDITEAAHFKTIGTVKSVTNANSDSLRDYFNRVYTANNAHLIICGNIPDVDILEKHIRDVYVNLREGEQLPIFPRKYDVIQRMGRSHNVRYSSDPINQSMYGIRVNHEMIPQLTELFQMGCSERLFVNLVQTRLCDDACMFIEKQSAVDAVCFVRFNAAKSDSPDVQMTRINEAINKSISEPWTNEELEKYSHKCTVDYVKSYIQDVENFTLDYSSHQVMYKDSVKYGNPSHPKSYIKDITVNDLMLFASKIDLKYRAGFGQEYVDPDSLRVHSLSSHPNRQNALGKINMDRYLKSSDTDYKPIEFDINYNLIDGNIFIRNKRKAIFNSITVSPLVPDIDRFTVKSIERMVFDRAIGMTPHFLQDSHLSQDETIAPDTFTFPAVESMDALKEKIRQFREIRSRGFASINREIFNAAVSSIIMEHYSNLSSPIGITFDKIKKRFIIDESNEDKLHWSPENIKNHLSTLDLKSIIEDFKRHNDLPLFVTCNFDIGGYDDRVLSKVATPTNHAKTGTWQGNCFIKQPVPQYFVTHSRPGSFYSSNPDFHTKGKMFEFIFSGGLGSRLMQLRTNYGWMYSLSGGMSYMNGVDHTGVDFITTQLDRSVVNKYLDKIIEMTSQDYWIKNPITHGEFIGAKEMISNSYLNNLSEHKVGYAAACSSLVKNYASRMNAITIEDIQGFAEKQSEVGFDYVVIVGPEPIEMSTPNENVISDRISSIIF